ncbi:MAG: acetyl-CoA carboxylase biotin carboxyl carrier protein subunit [Bacteroidetes bacterium]|nr:acetyl-CoA carboxylase biotin carboxyl carrier protein subunit [Bacteroidota bacterium]
MYKISVNQKPETEIKIENGQYFFNNLPVEIDIIKNIDGSFHALHKGISYNIKVVENLKHYLVIEINEKKYNIKLKNDLEDLLEKMGMEKFSDFIMQEVKAPMPGMVLKILVNEGDEVKKGDNLITLEAMKMENIIKATGDGKVMALRVKQGEKVEKNQVLINF